MFHLGWFLGNGYGIQPWSTVNGDGPWVGTNARDWMKPDLYVDLSRSLERAGFTYLLIEDTAMVEDSFRGSAETSLRRGFMTPKNDPMPLVPLMAQATRHLGFVPTASVIQYHPYMAARLFATLDHLTEGRVAVNVVTSVTDRVAQNYGMERHLDHDERYVMAQEWVECFTELQRSWEPGAVLMDEVGGVYADHEKVHPVEFVGKYFRSRGPLNTMPGPQGRVPIASAGGSPAGRDFAARVDDTMMALCKTPESMQAYRDDMYARLRAVGRDPESVKFLFLASPVVAETDELARDRAAQLALGRSSDAAVEYNMWNMSYISGGRIDFGAIDPDTLVEDIDLSAQNGEVSSMEQMLVGTEGQTLRQVLASSFQISDLGLVGSPATVASKMGELMEEVGGDGFLIYLPTTRRSIAEVTDGLAPELRRRGLIRDGYTTSTLRDSLAEF